MKILILDTRNGGRFADLIVLDNSLDMRKLSLGYVPELHYDPVNQQIVVVETELAADADAKIHYWLKCYSADDLTLLMQKETPPRPMYTGFPGRSTRVKSSRSGRYLYVLESLINPEFYEIYRLLVHRYDRTTDEVQYGKIKIDSCMIDFAPVGEDDDQMCFHLACEFPSTVTFGDFSADDLHFLPLINLSARTYGTEETCGSCFSEDGKYLYCINGEGLIYKVNTHSQTSSILTRLKIKKANHIPLQQIYTNQESLFVGVSKDSKERSLSLASQIWRISIETGEVIKKYTLPFPVMNFITTPDNYMLIGVSPYEKALVFVTTHTGKVWGVLDKVGQTPAEIFFIPE